MRLDKPYNFRLVGRAKEVFKMLALLATTKHIEADYNWWQVRTIIIANDQDSMASQLSMTDRLVMRRN